MANDIGYDSDLDLSQDDIKFIKTAERERLAADAKNQRLITAIVKIIAKRIEQMLIPYTDVFIDHRDCIDIMRVVMGLFKLQMDYSKPKPNFYIDRFFNQVLSTVDEYNSIGMSGFNAYYEWRYGYPIFGESSSRPKTIIFDHGDSSVRLSSVDVSNFIIPNIPIPYYESKSKKDEWFRLLFSIGNSRFSTEDRTVGYIQDDIILFNEKKIIEIKQNRFLINICKTNSSNLSDSNAHDFSPSSFCSNDIVFDPEKTYIAIRINFFKFFIYNLAFTKYWIIDAANCNNHRIGNIYIRFGIHHRPSWFNRLRLPLPKDINNIIFSYLVYNRISSNTRKSRHFALISSRV